MTDVSSEISPDFFKMKDDDDDEHLQAIESGILENELNKSLKSSKRNLIETVDDSSSREEPTEEVKLDRNESAILENELDESLKPLKRKLSETVDDASSKEEPPKKVILDELDEFLRPLKRKLIESVDDTSSSREEPQKKVILTTNEMMNNETVTSENKPEEQKSVYMDERKEEKKIIKLSQFSAKERLEMRAKKFCVTSSNPDALKAVREKRFGNSNGNNSATSITSSNVITSVDKLKQRAIRFGGSVSTVMSNLENWEKLEKRKARFGASANRVVPESEKAILRLERFKQPVE